MAKITIDGSEYELEALPDEVKATLASIRFVDEQLHEKRNQLAIADTARIAYSNALNKELKAPN
jgi:hypothetical protein